MANSNPDPEAPTPDAGRPPDKQAPARVIRLLRELQHRPEAQRQAVEPAAVSAALANLRRWQADRLASTYADLLADPQYAAAGRFFLSDIYGDRDFTQRDYDAEKLFLLLRRFLPESMLRLLSDALALNRLTDRLDRELLAVLDDPQNLTTAGYAQAYRRCDNYSDRLEQIELLAQVLRSAALGARGPVFAVGLRLARLPAQRAGWDDLYGFLERGYLACRPLRNVSYFVDTIYQRETTILNNLFSASPNPFDIG